jgi:hypothetical protein
MLVSKIAKEPRKTRSGGRASQWGAMVVAQAGRRLKLAGNGCEDFSNAPETKGKP